MILRVVRMRVQGKVNESAREKGTGSSSETAREGTPVEPKEGKEVVSMVERLA